MYLPDIPTYLQGQWERMCGRCQSRVLPLHVGVMQKKYETVRLMLDLGADPNTYGTEFTGDARKDAKKRLAMMKEKKDAMAEFIAKGADSIPYARLWHNPAAGLWAMLSG